MATSKKQPQFEIEKLFPGLMSLVNHLPTEKQKQEIDQAFTQLIDFLQELQSRFQTIPSLEDADQARQALSSMQEFLESAAKHPSIAAVLGGASSGKKTKKPTPETKPQFSVAAALEELESLPSYEIRVHLEKYILKDLRAIATELELSTPPKITKPDLVIQIVGYFLNRRSVRNEEAPMFDASMKIPGGWPSS
jgi:hypothetical protein